MDTEASHLLLVRKQRKGKLKMFSFHFHRYNPEILPGRVAREIAESPVKFEFQIKDNFKYK